MSFSRVVTMSRPSNAKKHTDEASILRSTRRLRKSTIERRSLVETAQIEEKETTSSRSTNRKMLDVKNESKDSDESSFQGWYPFYSLYGYISRWTWLFWSRWILHWGEEARSSEEDARLRWNRRRVSHVYNNAEKTRSTQEVLSSQRNPNKHYLCLKF